MYNIFEIKFCYRYTKNGNRARREVRFKNDVQDINNRRLYTVRTCTMYLQADQKLYESVYNKEGNRDHIRF